MSGREFLAAWAAALGALAVIGLWVVACCLWFGLPYWAAVTVGTGAPLLVLMPVMWLAVRR